MKKRIYVFSSTVTKFSYIDFIREGDSDFYIRSRSEDGIQKDKVHFERFQKSLNKIKESSSYTLLKVIRR